MQIRISFDKEKKKHVKFCNRILPSMIQFLCSFMSNVNVKIP